MAESPVAEAGGEGPAAGEREANDAANEAANASAQALSVSAMLVLPLQP